TSFQRYLFEIFEYFNDIIRIFEIGTASNKCVVLITQVCERYPKNSKTLIDYRHPNIKGTNFIEAASTLTRDRESCIPPVSSRNLN
ncbi:22314_t:CDS:2, partial [Racocetra persica]